MNFIELKKGLQKTLPSDITPEFVVDFSASNGEKLRINYEQNLEASSRELSEYLGDLWVHDVVVSSVAITASDETTRNYLGEATDFDIVKNDKGFKVWRTAREKIINDGIGVLDKKLLPCKFYKNGLILGLRLREPNAIKKLYAELDARTRTNNSAYRETELYTQCENAYNLRQLKRQIEVIEQVDVALLKIASEELAAMGKHILPAENSLEKLEFPTFAKYTY